MLFFILGFLETENLFSFCCPFVEPSESQVKITITEIETGSELKER